MMKPDLHLVEDDELPIVKQWLEQFLPDSFKLCFTIRDTIEKRWSGTKFCTLGWPHIHCVGEIGVIKGAPAYEYHTDPMTTSVFSPTADDLETFLNTPGFLDWSKPISFQAVSHRNTPAILRVISSKGGDYSVALCDLFQGDPEKVELLPVPEGFSMGQLKPDLHTDYIMSTWPHKRYNSHSYIRALRHRYPSLGLFDRDGQVIGLEIGNEYSAIGMLHVREEYRGRNFGKLITSRLVHEYSRGYLPVMSLAIKDNMPARRLHTSCGFEEACDIDLIMYHPEDIKTYMKSVGYNGHEKS